MYLTQGKHVKDAQSNDMSIDVVGKTSILFCMVDWMKPYSVLLLL